MLLFSDLFSSSSILMVLFIDLLGILSLPLSISFIS